MSDKTTYESLDNRIAPEALTEDHTKGLAVVDGHAVKSQEDYEDPNRLYDMLIARILPASLQTYPCNLCARPARRSSR